MSNYTNCILDKIKEISENLSVKNGYFGKILDKKKKEFSKTNPENADKLVQDYVNTLTKDFTDKFQKKYDEKLSFYKYQDDAIQKRILAGEDEAVVTKNYDTSRTPEQKASDTINSDYINSALKKRADLMNRLETEQRLSNAIDTNRDLKGNLDPSGTLESFFTMHNKNQRYDINLEFQQKAYQNRIQSMWHITDSMDMFRRDKPDFDARDTLAWFIDGKGKNSANKVYAGKLKKMLGYIKGEKVRLGDASNVRSEDNFLPMMWQKSLVTKNIPQFKEWAINSFDWAKMSKYENVGDEDKWLDQFINDLTSLNSGKYSRVKRKRIFFNNADNTYDAMELYGGGYNNVMGNYSKSQAQDLALLKTFGTNPVATKDFLMNKVEALKIGLTDKKQIAKIDKNLAVFKSYYDANVQFNSDVISDNAITLGKINNYGKSVILGGSGVTNAFLDTANLMMYSGVHKIPALKTMGGFLKNIVSAPSKDKEAFLKDIGIFTERYNRMITGFVEGQGQMQSAQMVDRTVSALNQFNGAPKLSASLRAAVSETNMADLTAGLKDLSFERFNEGMGLLPEKTGITADDWSTLKSIEPRKVDGADIIFIDDIAKINEDLAHKVSTYNTKKLLDITPEAGFKTSQILGLNYSKGTVFNVLAGTITDLMSTPAALATNARRMTESLAQRSSTAAATFLVGGFIATSVMAAMKIQMNELSKGNTMIDWDNKYLWGRAALSYNSFSVFTEIPFSMFGYGANPVDSPAIGTIGDIAKTAKSGYDALTGDGSAGKFGGNVISLLNNSFNPAKAHPLTTMGSTALADGTRSLIDRKWGERNAKRQKKKLTERGQKRIYSRGFE